MLKNEKLIIKSEYKEYRYRIVIVAIFCILTFVNGAWWVVVSPISVPVGKAYGQSDAVVALIPMCFMILYPFINFPSNWVLDVRGIKNGVLFGAVLTSLGAAIRCLVATDFFFVIIGQILCAIGQPFILNAPIKIAIRWFSTNNVKLK
jgi:fucose permease